MYIYRSEIQIFVAKHLAFDFSTNKSDTYFLLSLHTYIHTPKFIKRAETPSAEGSRIPKNIHFHHGHRQPMYTVTDSGHE